MKVCPHGHANDEFAHVCGTCQEPLDQVHAVDAPPVAADAARAAATRAAGTTAPLMCLEGAGSTAFRARIAGQAVVGRGADVDVSGLDTDLHVSRQQARLFHEDGHWWIEHIGNSNPTLVGGVQLAAGRPVIIEDGDRLTFADLVLVVRISS
jgi:hypothetical protein